MNHLSDVNKYIYISNCNTENIPTSVTCVARCLFFVTKISTPIKNITNSSMTVDLDQCCLINLCTETDYSNFNRTKHDNSLATENRKITFGNILDECCFRSSAL